MTTLANATTLPLAAFQPQHFALSVAGKVATVTLNRPEKKNPLTFASYRELTDFFLAAQKEEDVKAIVVTGAGGNFSSGGDVFEIIGPLVAMETKDLLKFTRMTGELVKAIRACPQPVIAAIDGVCAGAGAIIAMASDLRLGTAESKIAFLFNRVGLAGCDMGACAMLPRIIGQGRAAELLYTGRTLQSDEGLFWGFWNAVHPADEIDKAARALAERVSSGPNFAHMMTKTQLNQEWAMSLETAIESEAQAQAICMQTEDFRRAYRAFVTKEKPVFEGD